MENPQVNVVTCWLVHSSLYKLMLQDHAPFSLGQVPWRWSSLESLLDRVYTYKSNVLLAAEIFAIPFSLTLLYPRCKRRISCNESVLGLFQARFDRIV